MTSRALEKYTALRDYLNAGIMSGGIVEGSAQQDMILDEMDGWWEELTTEEIKLLDAEETIEEDGERGICNRCNRPEATQEDYDDTDHPEGCDCEHCASLCWGDNCQPFDWRGRIEVLEKENARLREGGCGSPYEPLPAHAAKVLDAAQARIEELESALAKAQDECFKLATGCCEHLLGDAHGNPTCKYRGALRSRDDVERLERLEHARDLLDTALGDTDPCIGDEMTQADIESEHPVYAACRILSELLAATDGR